jgi:hypothetical protein
LASDIGGLDGPNGKITTRWGQIAAANGLSNPYGIGNAKEFNHWQLPPQPLEQTPQVLSALRQTSATGDTQAMWNAYTPTATGGPGAAASVRPSYTFTMPANAPMGMGNNNPLNIKYYQGAEKDYPGLVGPSSNTDQGDPQMKFATPEAGWHAAYQLLSRKYGAGKVTPNMIIAGQGGWTPGNTQAAANVAKYAGIGPNDDIKLNDPASALKFMRALALQEQGQASKAYPDEMIAAGIAGKIGAGTPIVATAKPAQAPVAGAYAPPSPEAMLGSSLGQELGSMSAPSTVRSGGGGEMDTPDQPAIRSMAAQTDFMQPANPMPAQFAGGASGLGSQLGSLAAQPNTPMLEDPNASPSITAGAPSMTGMLGDLGTTATPGTFDQRGGNQLSPNPYRRAMRLA